MITNLGRIGSPLIRYRMAIWSGRTLNLVPAVGRSMLLDGGVLGRADDMTIVRGVNVFPSAVENLLREFPDIEEFRVGNFSTILDAANEDHFGAESRRKRASRDWPNE